MDTDFLDAHERHWSDAEYLKESDRFANADHLYGTAAECGLKRLMITFGMSVDSDGVPEIKNKKHADVIWASYETYRAGCVSGTDYALPAMNPFFDWKVNQRYAKRSEFDANRIERHRKGAEEVRKLINKAQKDGLI